MLSKCAARMTRLGAVGSFVAITFVNRFTPYGVESCNFEVSRAHLDRDTNVSPQRLPQFATYQDLDTNVDDSRYVTAKQIDLPEEKRLTEADRIAATQ